MNSREYEIMFRREDSYWWYRGMRAIARTLSPRTFARPAGARALDAGCGTGRNLVDLAAGGPAVGVDLSLRALGFARRRGAAPLVCASVEALPFRASTFRAALSRDVLYMVPDDARAAREIARVLGPGGEILVSSPAFESLRGAHDAAVGTLRRYRRAGLVAGRSTYANFFLALPIYFLRRWSRARTADRPREEASSDFSLAPSSFEGILSFFLSFESALVERGVRLPFGVTAFVLASKPAQRAAAGAVGAAGTSVAGK